MSRKVIIDFVKEANRLDIDKACKYLLDNIMPLYEDSVHTATERAETLESDTLWLLTDMVKEDRAINRRNPNDQHRIAFINIRYVLETLIASTAAKGIYLDEAFVKAYENVDMGIMSFGEFVSNTYTKWWKRKPHPEQTTKKPHPEAQNCENGVSKDSSTETPPGGEETPKENYIKLIPELQTTDHKAEKVFTAAYNNGYIKDRESGGYEWVGFEEKSITRKLVYMCAKIYEFPSWKDIEKFFGLKDLGRDWGNVKNSNRQTWMNKIDDLINKTLQ